MLNQLTALLSQYPQIKLAILFGSMAAGNACPGSDIALGLLATMPPMQTCNPIFTECRRFPSASPENADREAQSMDQVILAEKIESLRRCIQCIEDKKPDYLRATKKGDWF